jgi:hypothetical protein
MSLNLSFSPLISGSFQIETEVDVKNTIKKFWDEMALLMKDYADLSLHPDSGKTLQIGFMQVRGDEVNTPVVSMMLEDRLSKIEQAQTALLDIWSKMTKLEERLNSSS